MSGRCSAAAGLAVLVVVASSQAQEAANTPSATQPSPGSVVLRTTARAIVFDGGAPAVARDGLLFEERIRLALGLTKEISAEVSVPFYQADFDAPTAPTNTFDPDAIGVGDADLVVKYRVWKEDLGPVDTMRVALFAGTELPTSTNDFGSRSFDPMIGAAFTGIFGRHGLGASISWRFTTESALSPLLPGDGTADLLSVQAAYLYRLWPSIFPEEHVGAWYIGTEIAGLIETNGDAELIIAPGLLYEGPRFAFEVGVQLPVVRDVDHRPTNALAAYAGLRFLF